MVVEYVAAAALGDLRAAAAPASTQSITLSRGIEDTASFASLAARQLLTAAERYELLVACELVAALRAVRISRPPLTEPAAARGASLRRTCRPVLEDRDLTADIETAVAADPGAGRARDRTQRRDGQLHADDRLAARTPLAKQSPAPVRT